MTLQCLVVSVRVDKGNGAAPKEGVCSATSGSVGSGAPSDSRGEAAPAAAWDGAVRAVLGRRRPRIGRVGHGGGALMQLTSGATHWPVVRSMGPQAVGAGGVRAPPVARVVVVAQSLHDGDCRQHHVPSLFRPGSCTRARERPVHRNTGGSCERAARRRRRRARRRHAGGVARRRRRPGSAGARTRPAGRSG